MSPIKCTLQKFFLLNIYLYKQVFSNNKIPYTFIRIYTKKVMMYNEHQIYQKGIYFSFVLGNKTYYFANFSHSNAVLI